MATTIYNHKSIIDCALEDDFHDVTVCSKIFMIPRTV